MSEEPENKIVGLNRKPFVPKPAEEEGKIEVCPNSLKLAERTLEQVKAGHLKHIAVIALADGYPFAAFSNGEANVPTLSLLNLAADTLKGQIIDHVYEYAHLVNGETGEDIEEDEE